MQLEAVVWSEFAAAALMTYDFVADKVAAAANVAEVADAMMVEFRKRFPVKP